MNVMYIIGLIRRNMNMDLNIAMVKSDVLLLLSTSGLTDAMPTDISLTFGPYKQLTIRFQRPVDNATDYSGL
jgi:hypothetical protein